MNLLAFGLRFDKIIHEQNTTEYTCEYFYTPTILVEF